MSLVYTIITVTCAIISLLLAVRKWPNLLSYDSQTRITNSIDLLESRIRELESRQEFLVAELQKAGAYNMQLQRELDSLRRSNGLKQEDISMSPVLVAIGSDALLQIDLTSMRAVESDTGMGFRRILNATLESIKNHLDRARINGHPYDKVHLAVHSGPDGIVLGGTFVNSVKLSELLQGVKILLIAGCESDYVGDYLGVVHYVITMTEKVPMNDAALFCRAFWTQIGKHKDPNEALRLALLAAPAGMNEYVEAHW